MRIYFNSGNRYVTCPDCNEPFEWENGDLQIDPLHPEYFFVECTVCKGRMYMHQTPELKENYNKFSNK